MKEIIPHIIKLGEQIPGKDQLDNLSPPEKSEVLEKISDFSKEFLHDVQNDIARQSITLALWSGCVLAGKTIALGTRDGPNTPSDRARIFSILDSIARQNPVFCAGVEAAPLWKAGRNQPVSFDGVPLGSPVRKYSTTELRFNTEPY